MRGLVDLHIHTTASDGSMKPDEVVYYAKQKGIIALSITDHDTVAGIKEAKRVGMSIGVEIIPGIEISAEYDGELHILGYYIDEVPYLKEKLKEFQTRRELRNIKIVQNLQRMGIKISWEEVLSKSKGETVGRLHIGMVLVEKGYCKDLNSAFDEYLGYGKKAYVKKEKIKPEECIEIILKSGGIPVLAHPKYLNLRWHQLNNLLIQLKKVGLAGLEVYYSMNTDEETDMFKKLAEKHDLVATGGTDFHGTNRPEIEIGVGKGNMNLHYEIVEGIKQWFKKRGRDV